MRRDLIEKTALSFWSDRDCCYIVSSPLYSEAIGTGDSQEEAWHEFKERLDDFLKNVEEGIHAYYDSNGNPPKEPLQIDVRIHTSHQIELLSKTYGCTKGEVVDFLVGYLEAAVLPLKPQIGGTSP